ncbi:MAG: MarR family transcriptional regulator [Actinobacteria bacterium]|nr:MarR family transcriptional regulator [Actinomycetota bacterium]
MAKAKWLTDAEMRAWRGFIERSADLINIITKDLEPFGLDGGDYQLLAMLSEAPGRKMKMCDLAETLGLSRSGLTRRMEGVLKAKYVSRVGDQNDRRAAFAQITEKGLCELLRRFLLRSGAQGLWLRVMRPPTLGHSHFCACACFSPQVCFG